MKDMRSFGQPSIEAKNYFDTERIKKILGGDMKILNDYAKELGKHFADGMSTSQLRSVLDEIQKMPEKPFDQNRLQLLRPKLAYAAGRHKGKVLEFQKLLDWTIQQTNENNFNNFRYFVEAIVAYHRYYGGK